MIFFTVHNEKQEKERKKNKKLLPTWKKEPFHLVNMNVQKDLFAIRQQFRTLSKSVPI